MSPVEPLERKVIAGGRYECDFCGHNLRVGETVFVARLPGETEGDPDTPITRCEPCEQAQLEGRLQERLKQVAEGVIRVESFTLQTGEETIGPHRGTRTMGGVERTEQEDEQRQKVGLPPVGGKLSPAPQAPVEGQTGQQDQQDQVVVQDTVDNRTQVTVTLYLTGVQQKDVEDKAKRVLRRLCAGTVGPTPALVRTMMKTIGGVDRVEIVTGAVLSHEGTATKVGGSGEGEKEGRGASGGGVAPPGGAAHAGSDNPLQAPPIGREHAPVNPATTVDTTMLGEAPGKRSSNGDWRTWKPGTRVCVRKDAWDRLAAEVDARVTGAPYPAEDEARRYAQVAEKTLRAMRQVMRSPGASKAPEPVPPLQTIHQARFGTVQKVQLSQQRSGCYVTVVLDWAGPGGNLAIQWDPSWLMRWDGPVPSPREGGSEGGSENGSILRFASPDDAFKQRRKQRKRKRLLSHE